MSNLVSFGVSMTSLTVIQTGVSKLFDLAPTGPSLLFNAVNNLGYNALFNNRWADDLFSYSPKTYTAAAIIAPIVAANLITRQVTGVNLRFRYAMDVAIGTVLSSVPVVSLIGSASFDFHTYINNPNTPESVRNAYNQFIGCITTCGDELLDQKDEQAPRSSNFNFEFPIKVSLNLTEDTVEQHPEL